MFKRIFAIAGILIALASGRAEAANSTVSAMTAASALGGTELLYCVQSAADRKCTPLQFATYVFGLASGDITFSGSGVGALKNTGPGATGPLGSATVAPIITIDAQGRVTALTSATITPAIGSVTGLGTSVATTLAAALNGSAGPIGALTPTNNNCVVGNGSTWTSTTCPGGGVTFANPTATAGPTAINGTATTAMRSDGAPAVQVGSASQEGIVQVDGTTIKATAGVISAPPQATSRTVTGATDTILAADLGNVVYYNSASAIAITQPAPSGSFAAGFFTTLCNINAGLPTVTPGSGNIGGAGTFALPIVGTAANPACASYQSDGTNFNLVPSYVLNASLFTAGTVPAARLPFGTNVGTAAAATLSSAGGLTSTIFHGTATLGTSAISSGACATAVNVTATNVATTDVVTAGFSADPTATTGYLPTAMLTIVPYVASAGNIGVKVCNLTGSSITPSAVTINVSAVR